MLNRILIIVFIFCHYITHAQQNSIETFIQLKKLNVLGSVLYIGAHPDDENNTLLPYLAKEKLYRTAYLSLTRGDGGQNLLGDEQGIELGLIRTQELLEARKIDGCEQYFTSAYEFGFSKSADETLHTWDKEKILADVVWIIRKFQPDIIINRFPPDKRAGHGHHAAASILAQEAFIAAADKTKFTDQFKHGVQPWQAKRIVWNTFNFGNNNTTNDNQLKLEIGNYNALMGKSYGEIGGIARTMHKSQGEGRPQRKGNITEYFAHVNGDSATTDIMNNVNTHWSRLTNTDTIQQKINEIIETFNFKQPENSVTKLITIYNLLQSYTPKNNWINLKIKEVENIIMQCTGLFIEATTNNEFLVQGQKATITFFANNRSNNTIYLKEVFLSTNPDLPFDTLLNIQLQKNINHSFSNDFIIPANANITQPYWLYGPISHNIFQLKNDEYLGEAENKPAFSATYLININGTDFKLNIPIKYKFVHPVRGEIYEPVTVVPQITVQLLPNNVLTNIEQNKKQVVKQDLQFQFTSNIDAANTPVTILLYQNDIEIFKKDSIINLKNSVTYQFSIALNRLKTVENVNIYPAIKIADKYYTQNLKNINYEHISNQHYFFTNETKIINDRLVTKFLKIGYINGAGDKVADAIEQMGYPVTILNEKDLNLATLQKFDAIVTGIRAYNIHEYLTDKNNVLNEYIKNGGNLIVQYIKANTIVSKKILAGPYNFSVNSRSRVTEENAAVKFLIPNHEVLNYPNKITNTDFENWVQERSTYQAEKFDKNFECILGMNDTGEPENNSSLLIAKYGKGNFVYCGLTLFRQLPAGVAGSYKLLANILALGKH